MVFVNFTSFYGRYRGVLLRCAFLGTAVLICFATITGRYVDSFSPSYEEDEGEVIGPIEEFTGVTTEPPNVEQSRLRVHRVRKFDRVVRAKFSSIGNANESTMNTTRARCVVFSCASPGYFLVNDSLSANTAYECDRVHFATYTYNSDGDKVASTWCRVPLLMNMRHYFPGYERILYVDPDIRYRDPWIMKSDCDSGNQSMLIASNKFGPTHGMQMNWLLVCHPEDSRLTTVFSKWDMNWKDVDFQDQTVFNDVWKCGDLDGAIKCVDNVYNSAILVFHCGGYLTRFIRPACMRKHF